MKHHGEKKTKLKKQREEINTPTPDPDRSRHSDPTDPLTPTVPDALTRQTQTP